MTCSYFKVSCTFPNFLLEKAPKLCTFKSTPRYFTAVISCNKKTHQLLNLIYFKKIKKKEIIENANNFSLCCERTL